MRAPDPDSIDPIRENVERIVQVSDNEIREAMRIYFTGTHNVVEGAGAASLAAALKEKDALQGKKVGVVATGGNVDRDVYVGVLTEQGSMERTIARTA